MADSTSSGTAAAVGVTIAILACLLLGVLIFFYIRKRREAAGQGAEPERGVRHSTVLDRMHPASRVTPFSPGGEAPRFSTSSCTGTLPRRMLTWRSTHPGRRHARRAAAVRRRVGVLRAADNQAANTLPRHRLRVSVAHVVHQHLYDIPQGEEDAWRSDDARLCRAGFGGLAPAGVHTALARFVWIITCWGVRKTAARVVHSRIHWLGDLYCYIYLRLRTSRKLMCTCSHMLSISSFHAGSRLRACCNGGGTWRAFNPDSASDIAEIR